MKTKERSRLLEGCEWVVDIDLEKFFDKVNHDMLMARVARRVKDKKILLLISPTSPASLRAHADSALHLELNDRFIGPEWCGQTPPGGRRNMSYLCCGPFLWFF